MNQQVPLGENIYFVLTIIFKNQKVSCMLNYVSKVPTKIDEFLEQLPGGGDHLRSKKFHRRFSFIFGLLFDQNQVCKKNVNDNLFPKKLNRFLDFRIFAQLCALLIKFLCQVRWSAKKVKTKEFFEKFKR